MDKKALSIIKEAFRSFTPVIKISTMDNPLELIRNVLAEDPSFSFFVKSYDIRGIAGIFTINVQYINKDIPKNDIKVATSIDECVNLICKAVEEYNKTLRVVGRTKIDLPKAMNSFHERYASFYPNLVKQTVKSYGANMGFSVYEFGFEYRVGQVKLKQMEKEVDEAVKKISEQLFITGLSPEAKIYLAHNYLATTVDYVPDKDNSLDTSYTQSAYGAFIKHRCVCQGFAEAFKRLMDYVGIECLVIYGKTNTTSGLHAWNLVSLGKGSSYYHVDVTWDAAEKKPQYTYFCKNDKFFDGKRTWNKEYSPECLGSFPVLAVARRNVFQNKERLISRGVDSRIIDC